MPFPLAHPAAVLPLKRFWAQGLNFPALVIGTLVPDAAYLLRNNDISSLSHQILGSLEFGLPVGFLMLAVLYVLRKPAIELIPNPKRQLFISLCRPMGPIWLAAVSLMIGIWTHVLWDSFTHDDGWIVGHLSFLRAPVFTFAGRTARVCRVLWYASTFVGVGWLYMAFEDWRCSNEPGVGRIRSRSLMRYAILLSVFVVPVSLLRHLVRGPAGLILTAVLCTLLGIVLIVKLTRPTRSTRF